MRMMKSPRIFVHESNGRLVFSGHPWWVASKLDILNYSQVSLLGFGRAPNWHSFYNDPYFSKWLTYWLFRFAFQWLSFIFVVSSKEILQLSLLEKDFYLLLQVIALIRVMSMISGKWQYLLFFRLLRSPFIFFGHFKDRSSLICINTWSSEVFRGV